MQGCTGELMRRVKRRDFLLTGCIMDSRSGAVVEMYHDCGYDVVMIDREHTLLNSETILEHIRLARALGMPCMVRAADASYHEICRVLDQAPDGFYVPRIRSRAEVEHVVRTAKYAPLGQRGLGGSTCPAGKYMGWPTVVEQVEFVNQNLVIGIQIETAEALADLDGILSVPGIDVAVVGNDDLSLGMGIVGQLDHPDYIAAVTRVIAACERHGVLPGIACGDPARLRFWKDRGMRVFWVAADICLMWDAARRQINGVRAAVAAATPPPQSTGPNANV
ncbi:MAG: 4-hydroxy-2-oxo-heptane-1,7-dioate aldolase [Verrucomicrobiae bacterium]|nr:4-hydroxy-2-oxo-heptane-1,7-dioate aldolase [Verrucomicrobiae bacterium]